MRAQAEFTSGLFPCYSGESEAINPGRFGKRLAEYLAQRLPAYGHKVKGIYPEDWGWVVALEAQAFPAFIGCGNVDGSQDRFTCLIEPPTPFIRRWFRRIETEPFVEKLVESLDSILEEAGVSSLEWRVV